MDVTGAISHHRRHARARRIRATAAPTKRRASRPARQFSKPFGTSASDAEAFQRGLARVKTPGQVFVSPRVRRRDFPKISQPAAARRRGRREGFAGTSASKRASPAAPRHPPSRRKTLNALQAFAHQSHVLNVLRYITFRTFLSFFTGSGCVSSSDPTHFQLEAAPFWPEHPRRRPADPFEKAGDADDGRRFDFSSACWCPRFCGWICKNAPCVWAVLIITFGSDSSATGTTG